MSRYLLFDANCERCTKLAQEIERKTDGWLTSRSLSDCRIQSLLGRTGGTWQWRPTLLEVDDDQVQTFTGLRLGLRLATGLGLRRAWRVARLAWEAGALQSALPQPSHQGRRHFLQMTGVAAAGVFFPFKGGSGQPTNDQVTINDLGVTRTCGTLMEGWANSGVERQGGFGHNWRYHSASYAEEPHHDPQHRRNCTAAAARF